MSYGQFAEFLEMLHEFMILFLFSKSCDPWFKSFPKTCQESGAYCRDNKVSNDVEGKTLAGLRCRRRALLAVLRILKWMERVSMGVYSGFGPFVLSNV
jgi:hypothetical protein